MRIIADSRPVLPVSARMTQLVRHFSSLFRVPRGGIVTIGNFDGVHSGHTALLQAVVAKAHAGGRPAVAITFEPLPATHFAGTEGGPPRLSGLRDRFSLMKALGIDAVIVLPFADISDWSPEQFVRAILIEGLAAKEVMVGEDFCFGRKRAGNVELLGRYRDFSLTVFPAKKQGEERISSTRIREALVKGDFAQAEACMGRPFAISGKVVQGERRGRVLGFPTANILLPHLVPVSGVYAVWVRSEAFPEQEGVANVGVRPTVVPKSGKRRLLEVHLPHFSQDIYGKRLEVIFCHKIRDEKRFADLSELKAQIARDTETACDYFRENKYVRKN